jgi:putative transposase
MRHVVLVEEDKLQIEKLLSKGTLKVRTHKRGLALQYLDSGKSYKQVSDLLTVSSNTLIVWATNYRTNGLSFLKDKPRSGRPVKFDGKDRATITALACSEAPDGRSQWSLRLLADRLVELEMVETISYCSVGLILKKMSSSPIENVNGALRP